MDKVYFSIGIIRRRPVQIIKPGAAGRYAYSTASGGRHITEDTEDIKLKFSVQENCT